MRRFLLVITVVVLLAACADKKNVVSDKDTQIPDAAADTVGVIDEEYIPDDAIVIDDGDELFPDSPENEIPVDTDILYTLTLEKPKDGAVLVVGHHYSLRGTTNCFPSTVTLSAQGQDTTATANTSDGSFWSGSYSFDAPTLAQPITVTAIGDHCTVSVSFTVVVQPKEGATTETVGSGEKSYTIHRANYPTGFFMMSFGSVGTDPFQTVRGYAEAQSNVGPLAAVNGGYFDTSGAPTSYWKGSGGDASYWYPNDAFVWESPSGNVDGPRACLVHEGGEMRLELSMGRDPQSGDSLYPDAYEVVCGGPQLVKEGINVLTEQIAIENFETSVLLPDEELPRTAACVTNDGSLVIVAALADDVRFGPTLTALADYLISIGCVEALNLAGDGATAFWSKGGDYHSGVEDPPVSNALILFVIGE